VTNIHWDMPFYIDPATGETTSSGTPGAIPFPTYGHYGGGGFSADQFGGALITKPDGSPYSYQQLLSIGTPEQDPVDKLDYLFYVHDVASSEAAGYTQLQANADIALLKSLVILDASYDPEASLYAGAAELGMIGSLGLHHHLGDVSPAWLLAGLTDAAHDIQYGLGHLPQAELATALSTIFEPTADPNVFAFHFSITTKSVGQEFVELTVMNALNAALDSGEADNVPLHTGFPFPGTTDYEFTYNIVSHDLNLVQ